MGSRYKDERLINKVDELAASLHATSEVLSTADNMLEHYRDLNREQDVEIARLNDELWATKRPSVSHRSRRRSLPRTPSISDVEERRARATKVKFTDEESNSDIEEFETALRELNRKQHRLEKELKRNQRNGTQELKGLMDSLKKDSDDSVLEKKLKEIQQQLEIDRIKKSFKDENVEKLADEIRHIRGLVQSRESREPLTPRHENSSRSFVEELRNERERSIRDQEMISDLQRQLRQREEDQEKLLSQLRRTRGELEESDAGQRRLSKRLETLEENFEKEKSEKRKLEEEIGSFKTNTTKISRENAELTTQMQYLRDQSRPSSQLSDFQRRLDDLEREREKAVDNQNSYRNELDRKDVLVDKMTSQIRELTGHMEKAESEKRRYRNELEDNIKKLRDYSLDLEDLKSALKDRDSELRESEQKRQELKSRALEAIKEYRGKCRDLEKDKTRLEEREEMRQRELLEMKSQNREFELESKKSEHDIREQEDKTRRLEDEIQRLQNQVSQLLYERNQLEEGLSQTNLAKKDMSKVQHEFQDLSARNAAISGQLAEETGKRRELEERLMELQEKQNSAKEEAATLYQQLQEERLSHAKAMRKLDEELKSISTNDDRNLKDLAEKTSQEKTKYENEIKSLQSQLAEERTLVKANQTSKDDCQKEMLKLNSENSRMVEENRRIRRKYQLMKRDFEEKLSKSEKEVHQQKERITELEDELRRNQENLLQTREAFKQSLKDIHQSVDSLLDNLMQEANQSVPIKSLSESVPMDLNKWSIDILDKLEKCKDLQRVISEGSAAQSNQFTKAQDKIQGLIKDSDQDKNYFLAELEKQNEVIKAFKIEKRGVEKLQKDKNKKIKNLQERVDELTKHLEQCTKILHATLAAMEERKTVLDDLDFLKDEQLEKERLHEKYIRHTERLGSLQDQLEDAKMALQGVKDENLDSTLLSMKVLQSLSPAPKRRHEEKNNLLFKGGNKTSSHRDTLISRGSFLTASDAEDERPPSKRSKELQPMAMTDREFNDSFVPRRE
ncbi:centrosomal protein of 128 kDa-like isoform X2 [Rhopilema esculentum]|uniref:centrosomal protein of 128 kDa-like isoform X2 n=1 Tax=Rhopilema esculentum TaxID=499914 RepID=UPI0031D1FEC8